MRYYTIILSILSGVALGQAPEIEWENTIGGGSTDKAFAGAITPDSNLYIIGDSGSSIWGDKESVHYGGGDFWLLELSSDGDLLWQESYGGEENEEAYDMKLLVEGGFIICGESWSWESGNKTSPHYGGSDYWILKLNSDKEIVWQKTYGGSNNDEPRVIIEVADGGFIVGGRSKSTISGNKTLDNYAFNEYDFWVLRLDENGDEIWQAVYGGTDHDDLFEIIELPSGEFVLLGQSSSDASDTKSQDSYNTPIGTNSDDYWVVKISASGEVVWDNRYGGDLDDKATGIVLTADGGYMVSGLSESGITYDKTSESFGEQDIWVLKLNSDGDIEWQSIYGGEGNENWNADIIRTPDGNYSLFCASKSEVSGNKTSLNWGQEDYWVLKIDPLGEIIWQKNIGGNKGDLPGELLITPDFGTLIIGYSISDSSFDKSEDSYNDSYWIVKMEPDSICEIHTWFADFDGDGFGNPSLSTYSCDPIDGYVLNSLDCNDTNAEINPDISESCNWIDDDCNGLIDDGIPVYTLYIDLDQDGFGNAEVDTTSCLEVIEGYVPNDQDCNDLNESIYPGAEEFINGIDDDCDGMIDEPTSIQNSGRISVAIYPNPSSGIIRIDWPYEEPPSAIILYDITGRQIADLHSFITTDKAYDVSSLRLDGVAMISITYKGRAVSHFVFFTN